MLTEAPGRPGKTIQEVSWVGKKSGGYKTAKKTVKFVVFSAFLLGILSSLEKIYVGSSSCTPHPSHMKVA